MIRHLLATIMLASAARLPLPVHAAEGFSMEHSDQGVVVLYRGELFTSYLIQSGTKPILWPLVGPTGKEMTRGFPMRDAIEHEKSDHRHHRSFWFDHGDVNGISFWHDSPGHGTIEHREFLLAHADEQQAVIRTRNDWVAPDSTVLCQDVRTLRFTAADRRRVIDFSVTVTAKEESVVFGDTKEGTFGLRVAGSMRAEREGGGTIVNSNGQRNGDAWGKQAAWVDYSGPVLGETVGIAILNHPDSLRFPTHWHVRTYGLFAANPFGRRDFLGASAPDGSLSLRQGESFSMHFRVILHAGDADAANLAAAFEQYARESVEQN
jgi:hypothetical protein